jgi:hypothetical protein
VTPSNLNFTWPKSSPTENHLSLHYLGTTNSSIDAAVFRFMWTAPDQRTVLRDACPARHHTAVTGTIDNDDVNDLLVASHLTPHPYHHRPSLSQVCTPPLPPSRPAAHLLISSLHSISLTDLTVLTDTSVPTAHNPTSQPPTSHSHTHTPSPTSCDFFLFQNNFFCSFSVFDWSKILFLVFSIPTV